MSYYDRDKDNKKDKTHAYSTTSPKWKDNDTIYVIKGCLQ